MEDHDNPAPGALPVPTFNPARPLDTLRAMLCARTRSMHRLTELMCYHSEQPAVLNSLDQCEPEPEAGGPSERHIHRLGIAWSKPAFRYARRAGAWLLSPPVATTATAMPASRMRSSA
jgi:hypothetical protein